MSISKGQTETLLGKLQQRGELAGTMMASKANPSAPGGLSPTSINEQLSTSLERLNMSSLDLYYLHSPDLDVPIRDSLRAVASLHWQGKFVRFGLSNYAAWQVAEIVEICRAEEWIQPTVYQGMYNALTRDVERELFPCLSNYGIAFHAYNPLAGGLLSGKYQTVDSLPTSGRFASANGYQNRYWKPAYFDVINRMTELSRAEGIEPAVAAIRWLRHHSELATLDRALAQQSAGLQHGIILGASSMQHFEQNMQATTEGSLPADLVEAFEEGWEQVRPACIKYFRP
ncbi:aldo/keto reductase family protein [Granulosicoccus antarcticus]|uniref:L-glyceraldehyde 3-phosphate reductase n=1 Tax=Granulosicoccus antarcticus IMCC3135 TaxID=1192854 RepID=A0A2Z2NIP8_9GAMM|nr:aldo/keto reductase [Granulosicoccus antarcticus]ASJ71029.1 L-glyceraldehyde 3-phosphate reductase [Granulosicoccus antarcticus IMCC3135]